MAKRKRLQRWFIRAAVVFLVLVALLATRIPQESLTRLVISQVLGVSAEVKWSSKWWTLGIDRIALISPNDSVAVVELRGLQTSRTKIEEQRFREIRIAELILRPHLYADDTHNLQWFLDFLEDQKNGLTTLGYPSQT